MRHGDYNGGHYGVRFKRNFRFKHFPIHPQFQPATVSLIKYQTISLFMPQLFLYPFRYKNFQERLIMDITFVRQKLQILNQRFWQTDRDSSSGWFQIGHVDLCGLVPVHIFRRVVLSPKGPFFILRAKIRYSPDYFLSWHRNICSVLSCSCLSLISPE